MDKQIFQVSYYGHRIEIVIDGAISMVKQNEVPNSVSEFIINSICEDRREGSFSQADCKELISHKNDECISYSGYWRILEINHQLLWRIVQWEYNRYQEESLTEASFIQYYGGCFGSHFYSKWKYYDYNFMKMIGYFGGSTENGQKFCDMVMEHVEKYEQREKIWKNKFK